MKKILTLPSSFLFLSTAFQFLFSAQSKAQFEMLENPLVDYDAYEALVKEVKEHRKQRLVNLDTFMLMSKDSNVVILDTRSEVMYNFKHIKGAVHLNFSDFTQGSLRSLIPDPNTKILIYCNNNFRDDQVYFVSKMAEPIWLVEQRKLENQKALTLALNIPTYINLYGYGYKNVYELSELVSVWDPRIQFEGTNAYPWSGSSLMK